MSSWPQRWKFICDPKKWVGKTIASVEELEMEPYSTFNRSIAVQFTDGARGWILGGSSTNILPSPSEKAMSGSLIITPEEYAEYQADKMRRHQSKKLEEKRMKQAQLERLKKELEG